MNISQPVILRHTPKDLVEILHPSKIKLARRIQNDRYELEVSRTGENNLAPTRFVIKGKSRGNALWRGNTGVSPVSQNPPKIGGYRGLTMIYFNPKDLTGYALYQ